MKQTKCIIITIDGPSASGKSTLARELAKLPGFSYLNTGAMYRAVTVKAMREGIDLADESQAENIINDLEIKFVPSTPVEPERTFLDGEDITSQLSTSEVSMASSIFSRHPCVRKALVKLQREFAERICNNCNDDNPDDNNSRGVVVEGRDTGTVVFPNADFKIFLTASAEERAKRRLTDLGLPESDLEKVKADIESRDKRDTERSHSPLIPAPDAIHINNSQMSIEETVSRMMKILLKKL
ncbi:MAG: (d)CMP kinase [bacterium]|nr:(d)CMP kinase [bacterium]